MKNNHPLIEYHLSSTTHRIEDKYEEVSLLSLGEIVVCKPTQLLLVCLPVFCVKSDQFHIAHFRL